MNYPKLIMKQTELLNEGFTKEFLLKAYKKGGIAWKADPLKPNSPVLYDTQALEKFRLFIMNADRTHRRKTK